ncbi:MAG: hypothetical protein PHV23_04715 [Candidatus Gracilibacteria bacterium]|nr:hypothetical protein [Candidatus Gracilibacteria bacterium]
MIGFEYKYISFIEVIDKMKRFNNYSLNELIVLASSITIMILLILYILPFLKLYLEEKKKLKERKRKKDFLKKISLQKDIEDKIAKEINIG